MDAWLPHPLDEALVELIAHHFRVLGEPMRIRLLDALRDGDATVRELQAATGASQQNISKHLGVMLGAGLVARAKDGNFSRYSLVDESVFTLCGQVCGRLRRELDERGALLGRPAALGHGVLNRDFGSSADDQSPSLSGRGRGGVSHHRSRGGAASPTAAGAASRAAAGLWPWPGQNP